MGMNPRAEDYERLAIRWADIPHGEQGFPNVVAAIAAFPELFAADRDALPQNDTDRAFALVVRAVDALDYKMVMAPTDQEAARAANEGMALLDEALTLDPSCFDARRIKRTFERTSRDETVRYLAESSEEVRQTCLEITRAARLEPAQDHWSLSVYLRPYLRWRLALANEQLCCGRYRRSIEVCEELLALDKVDLAGARMVAAYDYVKLEDAEGLAALMGRFPDEKNAWFDFARCCLAYKQRRLDDAAAILHQIVRDYPGSGTTLTYQDELPPGTFGHQDFAPGSADELYIAVSEAAVILDENCGDYLSPLSDWIAKDPVVMEAFEQEALAEEVRSREAAARTRDRRRSSRGGDGAAGAGGEGGEAPEAGPEGGR